MKIKNLRILLASLLTFTLIGAFRNYQEHKIKQDQNNNAIKPKIEKIDFNDVFIPAEKNDDDEKNS